MLLVIPSWKLGSYCPNRHRPMNHDTKPVPTTPSPPGILSKLAEPDGKVRMYNYMRRKINWPHIDNYVYATVDNCRECTISLVGLKKKGNLQLFSA